MSKMGCGFGTFVTNVFGKMTLALITPINMETYVV